MAIVPRKLKNGKTTYYVTFTWNGRTVWERSGPSKRDALALESERWRQVEDGTYSPKLPRGTRTTVETWFTHFFTLRTNRSVDNEISLIENHVLSQDWFAQKRLAAVEPRDCLKLVEHMRNAGKLVPKSISTVYGVVSQAFKRAVFEGVIDTDPTPLPRGTLKRKSRNRRVPYTREEVQKLTTSESIVVDSRVFNTIAFYTGMREGEICGRRWRDWLRDWEPLTALDVHSQYEDQPLKTDDEEMARPRKVPVHPFLERVLRWWWAEGFELVHLRKPTLDDFIVPHRRLGGHTKSSAYKAFRRTLDAVGVGNKTLHATRNTFISIARSNGAPKDVLETVTHNSSGDQIDDYTQFEWLTVCKAVSLFDVSVDPSRTRAFLELQRLDSNPGDLQGKRWNRQDLEGTVGHADERKTGPKLSWATLFDARQRDLLTYAQIEPELARPGLAICRGLDAAYRGDGPAAVEALAEAAEALGLTAGGGHAG